MKLVANIQLKPSRDQERALRETLERCNDACNWLSHAAHTTGKTKQYALHKEGYAASRENFGLTAQAAVRCIAKVADAYTARRANKADGLCTFRKHAAQPYDDRILRFMGDDRVNIWTLGGREKIDFVCGTRQRALLRYRKGESDLMLIRGKWYLACVCDVPDPKEIDVEGVLGVDFGVVNLAFDSLGRSYSGDGVERVRHRLAKRKAGLQRRGTKAAKRRLKRLSGKEARFRQHVNHCISKEIVATAERSRFAIAVEDLTHIRKRVKARKAQRNRLHSWSFAQLRSFISYKAKLAGIPTMAINPRNTSRTCPECGAIDKANRKSQASFSCIHCGHQAAADYVAARNIAFLAAGAVCNPALSSALASRK